jgi:hypothetical protein
VDKNVSNDQRLEEISQSIEHNAEKILDEKVEDEIKRRKHVIMITI